MLRGIGWWKTVTHDHLAEHADRWRAQHTPTPARNALPPACEPCLEEHPAARFNIRLRARDGLPCPDCHPGQQAAA